MRNLLVLLLLATLSSCNINSSVMFRTSKDFTYSSDFPGAPTEYRISPNDILSMNMFTNDGAKYLDISAGVKSSLIQEEKAYVTEMSSKTLYNVELSGNVRFPGIGLVNLKGLTITEAEKLLEDKYSKYYINPFVLIKVTNKRVLVFPGSGGSGQVINFQNDNITLLEAIAMAGGIQSTGKSKIVKLIRNENNSTKVFKIDLSGIGGAAAGNIILQANDVIYVEPAPQLIKTIFAEIAPVVATITSVILLYEIVIRGR